jgi:hypothetical protein
MTQEPFRAFCINERRKRTDVCTPPGVQLDHMMPLINASLKRWRVPHLPPTDAHYIRGLRTSGERSRPPKRPFLVTGSALTCWPTSEL